MNDEPAPGQSWCETLFHAHARGLILYGRALGLSHGEAEDVVQETFLALLKLPAPPDEPGRYLLRAFRNRSVNFRRSLWRRVAREFEARNWFEPADAAAPGTAVAMRCLATLPVEQREVIVLKIWHGHTFQAIADLLDLSPNTIAGRYRYGLQRLRTGLEKRQRNRHALDALHEPDELDELAERMGEPLAFLDAARSVPNP